VLIEAGYYLRGRPQAGHRLPFAPACLYTCSCYRSIQGTSPSSSKFCCFVLLYVCSINPLDEGDVASSSFCCEQRVLSLTGTTVTLFSWLAAVLTYFCYFFCILFGTEDVDA